MEQFPGEPGHVDTDERPIQESVNSNYWSAYINERDAAEFVGFTVEFLQNLRYRGGGPKYYKPSRNVRYTRLDIRMWLNERARNSTSEPNHGAAAA